MAREAFIVQAQEARIERARGRREEAQEQRRLAEEKEREELLLREMDHKMNADRMEAEEQRYNEVGKTVGFEAAPCEQEGRDVGFKPHSGHQEYAGSRGNADRSEEQSWHLKNLSRQPPKDERGGGLGDHHDGFPERYAAPRPFDAAPEDERGGGGPLGGHHADQFPGHYGGFKRDYDSQGGGPDGRRRNGPRDPYTDQRPGAMPTKGEEIIRDTDTPPPRPRRKFIGKSLEELEKQGFS